MSEPDPLLIPSIEALEADLKKVLGDRIDSLVPLRVPALASLNCLATLDGQPPTGADLKAGLRRAMLQIERPDLREAAREAFGDTDRSYNKELPERRRLAGAACEPAVASSTFRKAGGNEDLIRHAMATTLQAAQRRFVETHEKPLIDPEPDATGPRAWFVRHEEQRLGYRWLSYAQELRGDFALSWTQTTWIEIECLTDNLDHFEFEFCADDGRETEVTVECPHPLSNEDPSSHWYDHWDQNAVTVFAAPGVVLDKAGQPGWVAHARLRGGLGRGATRLFRITQTIDKTQARFWSVTDTSAPTIAALTPRFDQMRFLEWRLIVEPLTGDSPHAGRAPEFRQKSYYAVGDREHTRDPIQLERHPWTREDDRTVSWRLERPIAGATYAIERMLIDPAHPPGNYRPFIKIIRRPE